MGITEGEIYTVEELLYGLILHSGNDSAYALAEGTAGSVEEFTKWMNFKAKELGLLNTYFADPSGLDDSTYSTAYDLARLTEYALLNTEFRRISKTRELEIYSDTHKYMFLENQTNLLTSYPGVEGVKTGYTEEAGLCLITYSRNNGVELVGVVLNSLDRKGDMVLMLDFGHSEYNMFFDHHLLD
jgi:D-alanyl-D-alanine carboxypeptidase (penicillin-binding protein 5/6)